jgi:poly-beta-1,6-N-acetyl-D-glucosamine synthase
VTLLFWLSAAFVVYVYAGYPLGIAAYARFARRTRARWNAGRRHFEPGISIVIAARDEGARLRARIDNLLALDYPAGKRQIVVVSDGSTDGTPHVLAPYGAAVDVVDLPMGGKAVALNAGVARARHEIVVFADARQAFAPDALRELVQPMADPAVGGVTGELVLDAEAALFGNRRGGGDRRRHTRAPSERRQPLPTIGDGVGAYWRYEKAIRRSESAVGSTLGATGAIYAIRRGLWSPLPAGAILDDVLTPMRIVLKGFRVVFNDRARAFDRAAQDADGEARRKTRTLAGNYQLIALEPRLLLPWRNPVWLQFVSHKLARLAVPFALLAIFASSIALSSSPFYLAALLVQTAFYLLAGYGAWIERTARAGAGARPPMPAPAVALGAREVA